MTIISASRRTDIPAFYAEWFMNRIRDGYFLNKNPYNGNVSKINASPNDIECIAFWTRNAKKMLSNGYIDELIERNIKFYFQYTITGYSRLLDSKNLHPLKSIEIVNKLAEKIDPKLIIWRFDPIIISDITPIDELIRIYEKISENLNPEIKNNVISFVDDYKKTSQNMAKAGINFIDPLNCDLTPLLTAISSISSNYGRSISSCAENIDLSFFNIKKGKCIDPDFISNVVGVDIENKMKDKGQRKECGCIKSFDVGVYETCAHGCVYCYATQNHNLATNNFKNHDPNNAFIIKDSKYDLSKKII